MLRLAELELIDRHQRMVQRRIRPTPFPAVKSMATVDFMAISLVNMAPVMEPARCQCTQRREIIIAAANSPAVDKAPTPDEFIAGQNTPPPPIDQVRRETGRGFDGCGLLQCWAAAHR